MRQLRRATPLLLVGLVGAGVIFGVLVRPVSARLGTTPPQVGWGPATMMFVFAVLVGALAWTTWQSLHRRHERMTSDHGIKMLALSRSSLIVGGLFGGGYGGFAISYIPDLDTPLGSDRVWHAGGAALAGLLLVAAALLLEWACHIPGTDDEDPEANGAAASAA
ncbi:MAG: DUF3180 family protein [Aeromicrobium sp.]